MLDDNRDWLQSLKAGDEVAIGGGRSHHAGYSIAKVDRVTSTQIVIRNLRFNKDRGDLRGASTWSHQWLLPVTEEMRNDLRKRELSYKLATTKWPELDLAVLEDIVARLP